MVGIRFHHRSVQRSARNSVDSKTIGQFACDTADSLDFADQRGKTIGLMAAQMPDAMQRGRRIGERSRGGDALQIS